MNNTYSTDAINIKSYPLSENDNIVVMFSKDRGLIKGVAKGVKKPKSKLGAGMQMLVCNKLLFNIGKNLDTIKEAQAINPFNKLRYNLNKLTCAIYIAEIINNFCKENTQEAPEINKNIYNLLYATLDNIQNAKDDVQTTLAVIKFQLKFMKEIGLGLELSHCLKCSKKIEEDSFFSFENGGVVCASCLDLGFKKIKIHVKIKDFLCAILDSDIKKETKYDKLVNEQVATSCFNLLRKYIETQSGKESRAIKILEVTKVS